METTGRTGVPVTGMSLTDFADANSVALTRFAYLLCGVRGLAEDLVQDALFALYRRYGNWLPISAPVAYLRRAIVNGNISRGRRRTPTATVLGDAPDRAVEDPDVAEQDAMWRVLASLPERQRSVLVLRYYLDLPDVEIAAVLGCREGTVRSLVSRAFTAVRQHPALAGREEPR